MASVSQETTELAFISFSDDRIPATETSVEKFAIGLINPLDAAPEIVTNRDQIYSLAGAFTLACSGMLEKPHQISNRHGVAYSNSPSKLIGAAIERDMGFSGSFASSLRKVLANLHGEFSIIAANRDKLYIAADRMGAAKPLLIADTELGGIAVSDDSDILHDFGAISTEELEPGTLAELSSLGTHTIRWAYPVHENK